MRSLSFLAIAGAAALAAAAAFAAGAGKFLDPLDSPAQATRFAAATHLSAVARAGSRLVSVGVRGLIIVSDDEGKTWRQASSPVSSDLVAVRFVSARRGWASGHDGVILATEDGGERWVKQLDGRMAAELLAAHFDKLAAAGDAEAARLRKEVARNYENGPEMPMLDLWFEDEQVGWAAGPFGTLLGTRDGGKTWVSWMEKVDNPKMLHYNAVRGVGGQLYLASEQGIVFKLDRARQRFLPMPTGYQGSFFGVIGTRDYVLAYGLRGTVYRSRHGGGSWERVGTGVPGGLTGASVLDDGRLLFVSQDGRLIASRDQGDSFQPLPVARPGLFTDVVRAGPGHILITGLGGVQHATLP
ncbi:MAG TPA: YCF48-related protein [Ramlibacter sp.]|nr:YCF48-related protein [Ramlibacter sp.]